MNLEYCRDSVVFDTVELPLRKEKSIKMIALRLFWFITRKLTRIPPHVVGIWGTSKREWDNQKWSCKVKHK